MTPTWESDEKPSSHPISALGWLRVVARALPLIILLVIGMGLLLGLRLPEKVIVGARRPITQFVVQWVCKAAFVFIGIKRTVEGTPMQHLGAHVSNHVGWLDIFALNAAQNLFFVSKSEVAGWAGIGWLARATGTLFIERRRSQARDHTTMFDTRLRAGHRLLFFPEGTSTDGQQVLAFKTTLFQAFMSEDLKQELFVQPVTLSYAAPKGEDPRFYGWWGDMSFATHLFKVLAAPRHGRVLICFHKPLKLSDFSDRKSLALACETAVRAGLKL